MSLHGFRLKKLLAEKFRRIFECPVCGYDVLNEVDQCPKCLAYCMRWVLVLQGQCLLNELRRGA